MRRGWASALLAATLAAGCTGGGATAPPASPSATTSPTVSPTPTSDPDAPRRGGSLRIGLPADPSTLDPRYVSDDAGLLVVDALFDSLTVLDSAAVPRPALATDWDVSDDGRRWTFHLDPASRFHDGSPVTAADVTRSWNSIADGTSARSSYVAPFLSAVSGFRRAQAEGAPLVGLTAADDATLVVDLDRPEPELAELVAHPSLAPIPAAAMDDAVAWAENPVGNGPFQMAEPWAHNQFIRLSRATEAPFLDEVLFRIYADDPGQSQQYADFTSGQLQIARVPPDEYDAAVAEYGRGDRGRVGPGVLDGPRAAAYLYGFRVDRPPFDRPEVRRAISLLIDRVTIAEEVFAGTRTAADSLVPPGIPGAQPGACGQCRLDVDEARTALDALLPPPQDRETLVVAHNTGASHAAVADRIARALESAGFTVEVRELGLVAFLSAVRNGEVDLFRSGLTVDHLSSGAFLRPLFHSDGIGVTNLTGYRDEQVDGLLDEAARTMDRAERRSLYGAVERLLLEDLPMLPLVNLRHDLVVDGSVRGFEVDATGRVDLAHVWVAGA